MLIAASPSTDAVLRPSSLAAVQRELFVPREASRVAHDLDGAAHTDEAERAAVADWRLLMPTVLQLNYHRRQLL